jgi:hypothetical protein
LVGENCAGDDVVLGSLASQYVPAWTGACSWVIGRRRWISLPNLIKLPNFADAATSIPRMDLLTEYGVDYVLAGRRSADWDFSEGANT